MKKNKLSAKIKHKAKISIKKRPRRLRTTPARRDLVQETRLEARNLILPLFITEGKNIKLPITTMPGQFRLSPDQALIMIKNAFDLGIRGVALFPHYPENKKDKWATESKNANGFLPILIGEIKKRLPEMLVIGDVAMDPYSSDGHDGLVENGQILNDETLPILGDMALTLAEAGVDFIAPSDMMDGRIGYLRETLDKNNYKEVGIIAYTAKYASAFYGPFRDALDSAPKSGDKKTYQMNPANIKEALREALLDVEEGADIVMVKPGLPYLDVLHSLSIHFQVPLAVYNVSGEYAMIKFAAEKKAINEKAAVLELLMSFRRAGAQIIFTYHALDAAKWLSE
jgi:porphobilinogen synthase